MDPSQSSAVQGLGLPLPACFKEATSIIQEGEAKTELVQENEALMIKLRLEAVRSGDHRTALAEECGPGLPSGRV